MDNNLKIEIKEYGINGTITLYISDELDSNSDGTLKIEIPNNQTPIILEKEIASINKIPQSVTFTGLPSTNKYHPTKINFALENGRSTSVKVILYLI